MNKHVKAATRARLLANIVRHRAEGHPDAAALHTVVNRLYEAAGLLLDAADTDQMPEDAETALWDARMAAPQADAALPHEVIGYVSAPLTGFTPGLHELLPANPLHARQERELRARLLDVTEAGHLDSRDDDVVTAALLALLDLHAEHNRLAEEVEVHGRADQQPTAYRPHTGRRSAMHVPGRLTVFDRGQILAELDVPYGITPGEVWQLVRDAEPTHRNAA